MQLGLDAFFTKSPDVVNFVVFLVAHYNLGNYILDVP
jgi:hypothetical protein